MTRHRRIIPVPMPHSVNKDSANKAGEMGAELVVLSDGPRVADVLGWRTAPCLRYEDWRR